MRTSLLLIVMWVTASCGRSESTPKAECRATLVHLMHLDLPLSPTATAEEREKVESQRAEREADIDDNEIRRCLEWSDEYRRCLAGARYDHEVEDCRGR